MSARADHGCPHVELAVGWALHALEPAEETLLFAHLPYCTECAGVIADTEAVSAALGASLPQVEPPPELEQRIMAAAVEPAEHSGGSVITELSPVSRLGSGSGSRRGVRGDRGGRLVPRLLAAAAAVVLLAASVALGVRVVQLEHQRAVAQEQLTALSDAIGRASGPGVSRVALVTPDGQGVGMLFAGPRQAELLTTGLPGNNPSGQIYVLWGLRGGTPTALAGFDVAPDGPVVHPLPSIGEGRGFNAYAVSLERGRALPRTPSKVLASGQVES